MEQGPSFVPSSSPQLQQASTSEQKLNYGRESEAYWTIVPISLLRVLSHAGGKQNSEAQGALVKNAGDGSVQTWGQAKDSWEFLQSRGTLSWGP